MADENLNKHQLDADAVIATLSDGSASLDIDIAGEVSPVPAMNAPNITTFNSQKIKSSGYQKGVGYAQVAFTATWSAEAESTIREWEKSGAKLSYSVSNYGGSDVYFSDCRVHLTESAKVVPGSTGEATFAFEVYVLDSTEDAK